MTAAQDPGDLIEIHPVAARLGQVFRAAGHELHLVGGSVRDALMGRPQDDLDFTTDARPERILELVRAEQLGSEGVWTTGIEFGTVGVQVDGQRCEITTFRADRYDRVSRNPEVAFGTSLVDDLVRRDFTMNAMALSVTGDRTFTDPFGGLADLARGVLRTPAAPEESFADDPLRMLRAARFVSQLQVAVADDVAATMTAMARRAGPHHRRAGAGRADQAAARRRSARRPRVAGRRPAWPTSSCPSCRRWRWRPTSTASTRTSTPTPCRCSIRRSRSEEPGEPDLVLRWAAAAARHRQAGDPSLRGRRAGQLSPPRGGRRPDGPGPAEGAEVPEGRHRAGRPSWCSCICASTAIAPASGPTRRCVATSSTPGRCCRGCTSSSDRIRTTRNRRKAAALSAAYDALEERIATLAAQEELDAIRPDLDGNQIMAMLGLPAGPDGRRGVQVLARAADGSGPAGRRAGRGRTAGLVRRAGLGLGQPRRQPPVAGAGQRVGRGERDDRHRRVPGLGNASSAVTTAAATNATLNSVS